MKHTNFTGNLHIKFRQARRIRQTMTDSERLLWSRLRGNRLMGWHFRRQHVIRGFIVDFYCHEAKLAVEVDGSAHKLQDEHDPMRDTMLISDGLSVLHVPISMLETHIEEVLKLIEEKCRERISGCEATAMCPIQRVAD